MWFTTTSSTGGPTVPYKQFSSENRDWLQVLYDRDVSVASIAKELGRHRSSVYRELARNRSPRGYFSGRAQTAYHTRRQESRYRPKLDNVELMHEVDRCIRMNHSPDQVAGRFKVEHPHEDHWCVSHETIYKHIYERIRDGEEELRCHLRQGKKTRHKRLSGKDKRGHIPNRRFIDDRPRLVEDKIRRGDWEGDTVEGAKKQGYIATFVDRSTKYLLAFPLEHKTADSMLEQTCKAFSHIPACFRRTITVDNGKEFAAHERLSAAVGAGIYFAHPYHSWERGLNEHTNGLLRQYFPKSRSLLHLSEGELEKAVQSINNRPRKALNYRTPTEEFFRRSVALRS